MPQTPATLHITRKVEAESFLGNGFGLFLSLNPEPEGNSHLIRGSAKSSGPDCLIALGLSVQLKEVAS